ncbi:hypothetical protein DFP73DRAFT_601430 [Morchella snyderi]|nr:hypothetical protein DFP73DRAFT_601430 [Morchella snyderi]
MKPRTKEMQSSWEQKYKDSRRVITAGEWETQRSNFTRLYITKDFGLERVREIMAEGYGFFANKKQCKAIIKKWGLRKYLQKSQVTAMLDIRQTRARAGKKTEFRLGGQPISEERFERAKMRLHREEKGLDLVSTPDDMVSTPNTSPMGIEYSTPKPIPSGLVIGVPSGTSTPSTVTSIHNSLNPPTKMTRATSSSSAPSAFRPQDMEVNNEYPITNFITPLIYTHGSVTPFTSPTPEGSHINKAGDILPQPVPLPPSPATLNLPISNWEPTLSNSNISLLSVGERLCCIGIPCAPGVGYPAVLQDPMYTIDDSNMQMRIAIKDQINRIIECVTKKFENLAALMEEHSFLHGLGAWGPDKVTFSMRLVKVNDILDSELFCRYKAGQLVVLDVCNGGVESDLVGRY